MLIALAVVAAFGISQVMKHAAAPADRTGNAARAGALEIMPASAFSQTTLMARVAGARGTSAEPGVCTWYRNGEPIGGVSGNTLEPAYFKKGDRIEVEAAAAPDAPLRRSDAVLIRGTRPQITSALAMNRDGGTEVYAQVSAMDADGDPLTYRYKWYRNGEEIPGATGETVDVTGFRNGDRVHAVVTAFDGEEASAPFACSPAVLGSDAPAITSTPPQSLTDGRYVYQVTTTAHEAGTLSFSLDEAPAGMTIDGNGRIEWNLPTEQNDVEVHNVAVRVTHSSGGETVQRFSITTGPVTTAAQ
jgi:hypothetical protein